MKLCLLFLLHSTDEFGNRFVFRYLFHSSRWIIGAAQQHHAGSLGNCIEGMGLPTSHLNPWSSVAGTSKGLRSKIPVPCGMTGLVSSLDGFEIREKERKSKASQWVHHFSVHYLPNECQFHTPQFPDVQYRQPLTDEELWQVWCGSSKFLGWGARDASASGSQHLVCSKPSALGSAVLDCPQRLQGDSSFCAACPTTHTEEGGKAGLSSVSRSISELSLLHCWCVPAMCQPCHQPCTYKYMPLHHRVCLWLFWYLLWPNIVELPFTVHRPFSRSSESNDRLILIAFLSNLTLIISV